jgi:hypothetical protein
VRGRAATYVGFPGGYHGGPLFPPTFRAAGKPPVKGGRWSVRKVDWDSVRPWRAWTRGKGQRFSRRFETFEQAINHATMVAQMFADPTSERVVATIRTIYPRITEERLAINVDRYAKFPKPQKLRKGLAT